MPGCLDVRSTERARERHPFVVLVGADDAIARRHRAHRVARDARDAVARHRRGWGG